MWSLHEILFLEKPLANVLRVHPDFPRTAAARVQCHSDTVTLRKTLTFVMCFFLKGLYSMSVTVLHRMPKQTCSLQCSGCRSLLEQLSHIFVFFCGLVSIPVICSLANTLGGCVIVSCVEARAFGRLRSVVCLHVLM